MAQDQSEPSKVNSEAWNIAQAYTNLKILKQLVVCDKLETIALHGTEDIDDTLVAQISAELLPTRRVEALTRLKDNIIQLISNVKFAIRTEDKSIFESLRNRILLVDSMLDAVCYLAENQVSHIKELIVNEEWFRKMLNEMQEIKEELSVPINNAGLIFRTSDSMSFEDLLADIATGG